MQKIFVIGAGFMGIGIAQVCAQAGYSVNLMGIDKDNLTKAEKEIQWSLERLHNRGRTR